MNALSKVLLEITPNTDRFQALPSSRFTLRNESPNVSVLPYIHNHRELRTKGSQGKNDRLNISLDPNFESRNCKDINDIRTSPFKVEKPNGENFYMTSALRYPKKEILTKNLLDIQKDKKVFAGSRIYDKQNKDDEEEKQLIRKLEETRARKDFITKMLAENERKRKEREANIEKTQKLLNSSAQKIQTRYKLYKERRVLKGLNHKRRIEAMTQIVDKAGHIITQLTDRLNQESIKIVQNVIFIQRNARKFLAKKEFEARWRKRIHEFIAQNLVNVLVKSSRRTLFKSLLEYVKYRQEDVSRFFLTCTPGMGNTFRSLNSDSDSISQCKESKGFYKRKSVRIGSSDMGDKRSNKVPFVYKRPSVFSNNTTLLSYSSFQSNEQDQKMDPTRRFRTKISRTSMDDQSIRDISETINPQDEASPEKAYRGKIEDVEEAEVESPEKQVGEQKRGCEAEPGKPVKIKIRGRRSSVGVDSPTISATLAKCSMEQLNKKDVKVR